MRMPTLSRVALAFTTAALVAGCSSPNMAPAPSKTTATYAAIKATVTVTYEVDGEAYGAVAPTASLTMASTTGTRQVKADLPLMNRAGGVGVEADMLPGAFAYVSAQAGEGTRSVTCRIRVDGVIVAENESSGQYSIVTCKATV